jgi:hypothetical protein
MPITNYILAILFLFFAAVQYNDPDPIIWISIYSYASLMCFLAAKGKYYKAFLMAGIVVSFVWSMTLTASILVALNGYGASPIFSLSMVKNREVEEARESLGLLIVFAVLTWKYFEAKKVGVNN